MAILCDVPSVDLQPSGSPKDETMTPAKRSPLLASLTTSNKVHPESSSTPPERRHSKKHREEETREPVPERKASAQAQSGSRGEEDEEEVVCTMIGDSEGEGESQATLGDNHTYELNAELDDSGDTAQLIQPKKERRVRETR